MSLVESVHKNYFPEFKKDGPELHGPCFKCGGKDRFTVWPGQGNQKLFRVWCRQCSYRNDALGYVQDYNGISMYEACEVLNVDPPAGFGTTEEKARWKVRKAQPAQEVHQAAQSFGKSQEMVNESVPAIAEATRIALLKEEYEESTTERILYNLAQSFQSQDAGMNAAMLQLVGQRLQLLLAFVGHRHKVAPGATSTILADLNGVSCDPRVFDILGIDQASIDKTIEFFSYADVPG